MVKYEPYCLLCLKSTQKDFIEEDLATDEEMAKALVVLNAISACKYCYWKPYYSELRIRLGIRVGKENTHHEEYEKVRKHGLAHRTI